jgi:hypothetical protein
MMTKLLYLHHFGVLFYLILLAMTNVTYASPPVPSPRCKIQGLIEKVRFEPRYENPCLKIKKCPTDTELIQDARYYLTIKIDRSDMIDGDSRFITCREMFSQGSSEEALINQDQVQPPDSFSQGQYITATTSQGRLLETYQIQNSDLSKTFIKWIISFWKKHFIPLTH